MYGKPWRGTRGRLGVAFVSRFQFEALSERSKDPASNFDLTASHRAGEGPQSPEALVDRDASRVGEFSGQRPLREALVAQRPIVPPLAAALIAVAISRGAPLREDRHRRPIHQPFRPTLGINEASIPWIGTRCILTDWQIAAEPGMKSFGLLFSMQEDVAFLLWSTRPGSHHPRARRKKEAFDTSLSLA